MVLDDFAELGGLIGVFALHLHKEGKVAVLVRANLRAKLLGKDLANDSGRADEGTVLGLKCRQDLDLVPDFEITMRCFLPSPIHVVDGGGGGCGGSGGSGGGSGSGSGGCDSDNGHQLGIYHLPEFHTVMDHMFLVLKCVCLLEHIPDGDLVRCEVLALYVLGNNIRK